MKNKFIPLLFLCYFIAYSHSFALDKDEVIAYFQNSLKGLSSISLNFSDESHKGIAGSLNAIKGNKYRIITEERSIYCDGNRIWNFTPNDNKVIVSEFDPNRANLSIEGIFFGLIDKMQIEKFTKEHSTKKSIGLYKVSFKPNQEYSKRYKVNKVNIWINEDKEIKYISTEYNSALQKWKISNLKINPKIKVDMFKFSAPKDCKIIELD